MNVRNLFTTGALAALLLTSPLLAADQTAATPSGAMSTPTSGSAAPTAPTSTSATSSASPSIFDEDPAALTPPRIPDRIEGFNRGMFKFNDGLYKVTLRPISKGYAAIVPAPVRRGIGSFFHNLAFPTRFVGNLFEGKFKAAATETGRFVVNSVFALGFATPADDIKGLQEKPSDLGQAFGAWGLGHGTYLILPLLGPSSVRDGVGLGLSGYFLDPVHYLNDWEWRTGATAEELVNQSPELMDSYDQLKAGSVDPYVALRDAYSVRRTRRVVNEATVPIVPAAVSVTPSP